MKFTGKGAEILIKTGGATPAYVAVGQVAEIGNIDVSAEEVEVTTLDAGVYREYLQGFKDPGECQLTVMWDPALANQNDDPDGLFGLFASGETRDMVIKDNSSDVGGHGFLVFKGFIRDWSFGALNPDDPQQVQPTIRLSGPITLADTMPTVLTTPEDQLKRDEAEFEKRSKQLAADQARLQAQRERVRAQLAEEPKAA